MVNTNCDDLIVIVGAGASHDCHLEGLTKFADPNWRPPLTKDLFTSHKHFQQILNDYRVTHAAVSSYIAGGGPEKTPVETFLKQLIANDDTISRQQANFITLYLQRLLAKVSSTFLWDGAAPAMSAYNVLVGNIYHAIRLAKISSVTFVSLNYDLILEQAIESQFGPQFSTLEKYCGFHDGWSLIKFHGSVNWWHSHDAEKTEQHYGRERGDRRLIKAINAGKLTGESRLKGARIVIRENLEGIQNGTEPVYFPAMAIPVEGKYQAICPDSHVDTIKKAMDRGRWRLLVLGFSAKDRDVLDVLSPHWSGMTQFLAVNGGKEHSHQAILGFNRAGLQFQDSDAAAYDGGFSKFVADDEGLKSFLT